MAKRTLGSAAVSINPGTGLSGGGILTADRTLALANTAVVAGSYASADITVDAQGRLSAASNGAGGGGFPSTVNDSGTDFSGGAWRVIQKAPSAGLLSVGAWPSGAGENARLLFLYNTGGASGTVTFNATAGTITGSTTLAAGTLSIWSIWNVAGAWNARRLL